MEKVLLFQNINVLFDIGLRKYPSLSCFIKHQNIWYRKFCHFSNSVIIEIITCWDFCSWTSKILNNIDSYLILNSSFLPSWQKNLLGYNGLMCYLMWRWTVFAKNLVFLSQYSELYYVCISLFCPNYLVWESVVSFSSHSPVCSTYTNTHTLFLDVDS